MANEIRLKEEDLPLNSEEYAERLIAEIDAYIDEHGLDQSRLDEPVTEEQLLNGLYTRIYNEMAAVDLPRRMIEEVDDPQLFIHLLKQIEDEVKHARLLAQRIWKLGGNPQEYVERTEQSTKDYWSEYDGKDAIEIGAMMQCGSERMASFRVKEETKYFDDETREIYDKIIVPEEQFHAMIGVNLLRVMCNDIDTQRKGLRSSREIREIIAKKHDEGLKNAYSN